MSRALLILLLALAASCGPSCPPDYVDAQGQCSHQPGTIAGETNFTAAAESGSDGFLPELGLLTVTPDGGSLTMKTVDFPNGFSISESPGTYALSVQAAGCVVTCVPPDDLDYSCLSASDGGPSATAQVTVFAGQTSGVTFLLTPTSN